MLIKMRRMLSFLVWLLSFWTWKEFFLRWLRSRASHPASAQTLEHSRFQPEGQPQSKLARFLSSLPEGGRRCDSLFFLPDSNVDISFGGFDFKLLHGTGVESSYREFLQAVASSEIVFHEEVEIRLYRSESCERLEAFADALRQSGNGFRKLNLSCRICSYGFFVRFANCVSRMLLGNETIQDLCLLFWDPHCSVVDEELVAQFAASIGRPHILQILKSFEWKMWSIFYEEGIEELLKKVLQGASNVLENLTLDCLTSDAELECIGGMLASSTSLKHLWISITSIPIKKALTRGYTNIATALCSNQSLKSLTCQISTNLELKALLDPLLPKTNNLQYNTTLTKFDLRGSIGGKEGIHTLVDMICTNSSLLELRLWYLVELRVHGIEGIENVLNILEALKTNKSLKKIDLWGCRAVGGYKVLGAMMDLLLENHCIEDIDLSDTSLKKSGDASYVYSELSKRKRVELRDTIQGMANVKPTSGRVFLCGNPYAGKTRLRMSMKELDEFQGKDKIQKRSKFREKIPKPFKTSKDPKVSTKDLQLERTHGIEVDSVQCDGIGITIWDMAGQTDYHSFHELVMPNLSADGSCSLFLLMCDPMEQSSSSKGRKPSKIKDELETWLRFIASNTRRSLKFRPHVSIVMTHFDYWKDDHAFATRIDDVVSELKSQFEEVLEFDEDKSTFKVDGRDASHARGVFDFIKSHLKQLLERLPKTIRACEEVQRLVALWNADKSKQPLLKWDEFCEGMCKEVEELNDVDEKLAKRRKEFVAISLNDGGHIIYNELGGVLITNPIGFVTTSLENSYTDVQLRVSDWKWFLQMGSYHLNM